MLALPLRVISNWTVPWIYEVLASTANPEKPQQPDVPGPPVLLTSH